LRNFTGLDSPHERPSDPELTLDAFNNSADDLADRVSRFMQQRGILT
jgi:bifunctional enzyme CysN/CysC